MKLWLRIPLERSDEDDVANGASDGMVSDILFFYYYYMFLLFCIYIIISFVAPQAVELTDSWELWNSFRVLCEHHSQLSVALDVL